MKVHDSMRESVAVFLHPGETIQAIFAAMAYSVLKAAVTDELGMRGNQYRIFAVTSDRILILDAGDLTFKRAKGIVAELPRSTRLGPPTGLLWHLIPVQGEKLRVHRRFFKDIEAADAVCSPEY